MRRLLVLCLMVMLPFQAAWAVVAGIAAIDAPCAMARQAAPHGDHGADAEASAPMADAMADCEGDVAAEPCGDGSCSSCHGHAQAALLGAPVVPGSTCTGGGVIAHSFCGAPDHVPDHPLRPPLSRAV